MIQTEIKRENTSRKNSLCDWAAQKEHGLLATKSNKMAAKSRVARLESEIEKYRADSNWSKVLDLSRQVPNKSSQLG